MLDELRQRGVNVIDLTESNPTKVGLHYPSDLLAPLASPASLLYDPQPLGLWSAREAVSSDFARRALDIDAERIALTASTSEAYALLFKLLCDPGDAVLVPRPSYPLIEHLTVLESIEAQPYRLEYHGAWRIDIEHLRTVINERTRALLIVSPNNPTGSFLHDDDLHVLQELCASRQLVLIADEVFTDYSLDPNRKPASVLSAHDIITCSLGGLSKSAGLPQVKLGWIAFNGPESKVRDMMSAYEVIADTYLSVSTPVQQAAAALIESGAEIRSQIQTRIRDNLASLQRAAIAYPAVNVLTVEGGWSAVLQIPSYRSEERLVLDLLTEDHVLVHPGFFFDFEREAFLVISLLVDPAAFDRAVGRVLSRATLASVTQ